MNRQLVRRSAPQPRTGFTLVELLVVIVIIGILVGLLIPVLGMARSRVQEAAIEAEVASLSQAVEAFKTQYQTDYPPDFAGPIALSGGRQPYAFDAATINEFMARISRYRNQNTDVPRDAMGRPNPNINYADLDPSESLYFWLRGFSDDKANPLFGPIGTPPDAVQRTPIFDFDKGRLFDRDGDGFLEYYPRHAQDLPYVYFVHYNYVGVFQHEPLMARALGSGSPGPAAFPSPRPYLQVRGEPNTLSADYYLQKNNFAASDKFQILAAGLDNSFGLQVNLNNFRAFTFPKGPFPDKPHLDNIANFAEGTLEGQLP